MTIYFIRHGEPDYSFIKENDNCQWANLAPLSVNGKKQAKELINNIELKNKCIISSPYTRALQTSLIFANGKDIIIEPMLHEWLPSKSFSIKINEIINANINFKKDNKLSDYETKKDMINRVNYVLNKYKSYDEIIIIAHSRLITTYLQHLNINKKYMDYCEIVKVVI